MTAAQEWFARRDRENRAARRFLRGKSLRAIARALGCTEAEAWDWTDSDEGRTAIRRQPAKYRRVQP